MTARSLVVALVVAASSPALAQSPSSVPLRGNTPNPQATINRIAPDTTESVRVDPNARDRRDGRVAPPAAIDTDVQVIAPAKR